MSIANFNPKLVKAFEKMILGVNVRLSETGRKAHGDFLQGQWFFILAISEDESLTLQDQTHSIQEGCTLSDIEV